MKSYVTQNIFGNWNFFRFFRLSLAVIILIQAIQINDSMLALFGGIFLLQVVMNVGCCGIGGCTVPKTKTNSENIQDVEFVEIKEGK